MLFNTQALEKLGISTQDLHSKPMASKTQTTANTAAEYVEFEVPMDMLLYGFMLKTTKDTDGTAGDFIKQVTVTLDGSKVILDAYGTMLKAIQLLKGKKPSTGFYPYDFADEVLKTDPIYLKQFSSCTIKVIFSAAGSGVKAVCTPILMLGARSSYPVLSDFAGAKLLVRTFLPTKSYGTDTGEQEYVHMRTKDVCSYIFAMADNGTLSATLYTYYTLKLFSAGGELTPHEKIPITHIIEENTEQAGGNALTTGLIYVPFPDKLKTKNFTNVHSYLNIASAGTKAQLTCLETYILGGA
jgi:hypothetical protein